MKIITEDPKIRTKAFNTFKSTAPLVDNKDVYNKILKASQTEKINKEEEDIVIKVLNSYKKLFNKIELDSDDFVFSGHELNEVKNKSQTDIIRYIVYRYKFISLI